jgi:hypothetical protein
MVIFGGHDYRRMSVTRGVLVGDEVFLSDTVTYCLDLEPTPWDEAAATFRKSAEPAPMAAALKGHAAYMGTPWRPMYGEKRDTPAMGADTFRCAWCSEYGAPSIGALCESCELEGQTWENGAYM